MADTRIDYHMAEYAKLNSEIAELVRSAWTMFSLAVAGSAGTSTWLLANGRKSMGSDLFVAGFIVPVLLSVALSMLARANSKRISQMGGYLRLLEGKLGHPDLGWERYFEPQAPVVSRAYLAAWLTLISGNLAILLVTSLLLLSHA